MCNQNTIGAATSDPPHTPTHPPTPFALSSLRDFFLRALASSVLILRTPFSASHSVTRSIMSGEVRAALGIEETGRPQDQEVVAGVRG